MGLFDNLFGGMGPNKELTKQEAFAGILLSAIASDGHVSDEEAQGMWTILGRMKMFDNWAPDKFNHMMNRLLGILKREGHQKLMSRSAEALPEKLRPTAFCAACDLVLADGVVEDAEKEFLDELQGLLEISGDQALSIVEVMILKNQG